MLDNQINIIYKGTIGKISDLQKETIKQNINLTLINLFMVCITLTQLWQKWNVSQNLFHLINAWFVVINWKLLIHETMVIKWLSINTSFIKWKRLLTFCSMLLKSGFCKKFSHLKIHSLIIYLNTLQGLPII